MGETNKIKEKKIFATNILNEVLNEIRNNIYDYITKISQFYNYNKINPNNFLYFVFRKLTNQDIRDKIFFLIKKLKENNYEKILEEEKKIGHIYLAFDFIHYIFNKNPILPFDYFPPTDHQEILRFLKKYFYIAFKGYVPFTFFNKEEIKYYNLKRRNQDLIKINFGKYFEFEKVKLLSPFFENFVSPKDYVVSKRKINTAFDLGAFIGDTSFLIYKYCKANKIYAFEPDPDNFKILKENIKLNHLEKNVVPVDIGIGKKEGFFYIQKASAASEIKIKKEKNSVRVKIDTIDNFVRKNKIKRVDFIKMDIEGAEFDALKGAIKTLKRDKPDLLVAIYHKGEHFFEIPGWLKKVVPEYHLRFVAMNGASPIIERYIAASIEKI